MCCAVRGLVSRGLDPLGIGESCCLGARVTTLRRPRWRLNFEPLSEQNLYGYQDGTGSIKKDQKKEKK